MAKNKPDRTAVHQHSPTARALDGITEQLLRWSLPLAVDPGYKEAHNNLGVALRRQNQSAEAIEHYRRALVTDPDYKEARYNLANALAERGETAAAVEQFREALRIDPGYEAARRNLNALLESKAKK